MTSQLKLLLRGASLLFFLIYLDNNSLKAQSSTNNNSCSDDSLITAIKENWKFNRKEWYYVTNPSFINALSAKFHDCIYDSDTAKIIKYFGRHYTNIGKEEGGSQYYYLMYETSYLPNQQLAAHGEHDLTILYFYFDKNSIIKKIRKEDTSGFTQE